MVVLVGDLELEWWLTGWWWVAPTEKASSRFLIVQGSLSEKVV